MTESDIVLEAYRASLFACGVLGFAWLAHDGRGRTSLPRTGLAWLAVAGTPFLIYHGLGLLIPHEPAVLPPSGPPRMLLWVLLHATAVLGLHPLRWRPGPWQHNAARGAAAVAVGLAAGLAVGMGIYWSAHGSVRSSGEWNTYHLRPYALFAAACFAASWALAVYPVRAARVVRAGAAALLVLFAASACVLYARVPNRFWSTEKLIAAFDSDLPGSGNCTPDPDYRARRSAAAELVARRGPATVPALIEALKDPKRDRMRRGAIDTLTRLGPAARPAVPALLSLLWSQRLGIGGVDLIEGSEAAAALKAIGPDTGPRFLQEVLDDRASGTLCGVALSSLPEEHLPLVRRLARAEDSEARLCAAAAALKIEPLREASLAILASLLGDRDSFVAKVAAQDLGELGPRASGAARALTRALRAPDRALEAAVGLARIVPGSREALPVLLKALDAPPEYEGGRLMEEVWPIQTVLKCLAASYKGDPAVTARLEKLVERERGGREEALFLSALTAQR